LHFGDYLLDYFDFDVVAPRTVKTTRRAVVILAHPISLHLFDKCRIPDDRAGKAEDKGKC